MNVHCAGGELCTMMRKFGLLVGRGNEKEYYGFWVFMYIKKISKSDVGETLAIKILTKAPRCNIDWQGLSNCVCCIGWAFQVESTSNPIDQIAGLRFELHHLNFVTVPKIFHSFLDMTCTEADCMHRLNISREWAELNLIERLKGK